MGITFTMVSLHPENPSSIHHDPFIHPSIHHDPSIHPSILSSHHHLRHMYCVCTSPTQIFRAHTHTHTHIHKRAATHLNTTPQFPPPLSPVPNNECHRTKIQISLILLIYVIPQNVLVVASPEITPPPPPQPPRAFYILCTYLCTC
ncbi:hypothetical protein K504DRAFT_8800 [Pleomassaria siparia CBS 279.74]|uniref:Uncharacterized protein n=1 Tax=Pleomassaria siparia CBS 279.74 TaxID=1314801 RepID=A0A6G1KQ29_9PLEO|nr:hypothetical protein K504DRAFT_8800 [Pleomassaria siparia CBS 279.74]